MNDYLDRDIARKRFWREVKIDWLKNLLIVAAFGVAFLIASIFVDEETRAKTALLISGILLCLPAFVHVYVLTIWHWGIRYQGNHKLLWGAILLIETSGWMKIIYFFRHVLPDYNADKNLVIEQGAAHV
jgi:hypothetical protein